MVWDEGQWDLVHRGLITCGIGNLIALDGDNSAVPGTHRAGIAGKYGILQPWLLLAIKLSN